MKTKVATIELNRDPDGFLEVAITNHVKGSLTAYLEGRYVDDSGIIKDVSIRIIGIPFGKAEPFGKFVG